ncbi:DUF2690 domain-containing protein, partial [Bacillus subtilis]|uniref:DUF2690 domain-containing protein n=1 Tax=Bacillus subtilis TaxID=1423 RepID=UPI0033921DAC
MVFKKVGITIASSASDDTLLFDGANPVSTGCSVDAVVKASKRLSDGKGTIELRYSPSCKTAWGRIVMDSVAKYSWEANATVQRNQDTKTLSCQDKGGNGVVNKGQRTCYTPMVYD